MPSIKGGNNNNNNINSKLQDTQPTALEMEDTSLKSEVLTLKQSIA